MKAETIDYAIADRGYRGVLVYDEAATQPRPAVLMGTNWMGMTDMATERAKLLAADRYVVFVADMYGSGKAAADMPEAASLADPLRADADEARRRVRKAFDVMGEEGARRKLIDGRRAAIGFCFGGGNVLELARAGADVSAVVAIHADLKTAKPAARGAIKANILALHGSADAVVPKDHRDAFEAEMDAAGAKWQLLLFSGLLHAFTDVGVDIPGVARYDEPATRQTYARTHAFIADAFADRL